MTKTTVLCVLDGFGFNPNPRGNAVTDARKPNFDALWSGCPHTTLVTFGESVGLPRGQMGNSEVGHLTIGAGRVVEQWLLKISRALSSDAFRKNDCYTHLLSSIPSDGALHLIGLYSDGGVHSHRDHLKQLLTAHLSRDFHGKIYLHLITDGRDTGPQTAFDGVKQLEAELKAFPQVSIATVCGRFYAMDRDKRWERVERAYRAIALADGPHAKSASEWISASYEKGTTDEFIEPAVITPSPIGPKDGLIFWNFRADRMREIVAALAQTEFDGFASALAPAAPDRVLCFADYDARFKLPYLFALDEVKHHLGEVIADANLRQLRVAETEKYPHVTYFLNGGVETPYKGEDRQMVPSPRDVKTYDQKPEMSAQGVCDIVVKAIESQSYALIVVNFANCDMVGHTGVLEAAVKAVETVDGCLGRIIAELSKTDGQALVIADHGNAEQMINYEDGTPYTAHTMFPVPAVLYGTKVKALRDGGTLADVAPTILKIMGIPSPKEMTGKALC
jgi:2,3-bisphosphoglycerate-independent phosphoglycerate mutase